MSGKKRSLSPAGTNAPKRVNNNNNDDKEETRKKEQKVYECSVCNKKLSSKESLEHHKDLHSGVKKHKCPHCQKPYMHYKSIWNHKKFCSSKDSPSSKQENNNNVNEMSAMMEETVAPPGQCCVCDGGDTSPEHLAEHSTEILAKIGLIDEEFDDETQPTCVVCYRVFASKFKYIKHFAEKHPKKYNFLMMDDQRG